MFWKLIGNMARPFGSWCRSCGKPIVQADEYGRAEGICIPCRETA